MGRPKYSENLDCTKRLGLGHYITFGNTPWTGWKAGDILYFDWLVPHGTANCGNTPRFSMFVTGFMTDEMRNWIQNDEFREIVL